MANYVNVKCPNCNHSFTEGWQNGHWSKLGPEKMFCNRCRTSSNSGQKPYSKMSNFEKIKLWLREVVGSAFVFGMSGGFILTMALGYLFDKPLLNDVFYFTGAAIGIIGLFIYLRINLIKEIRMVEANKDFTPSKEFIDILTKYDKFKNK
tara:strand:+ start:354 stop:803 length:450 start_codon:yes stop_codon:yes gene_type:complete